MAEVVNIHAAKTHLSRLIARAEAGEDIVIARDGRPVARLIPLDRAAEPASAAYPTRGEPLRVREASAFGPSVGRSPGPDTVLPALVGRIVRRVDPVRVILFGSRATGRARDDSDYDILVVVDHVENRRQMRIDLGQALLDRTVALDLVVAPVAELEAGWSGPRGIAQWAAEGGLTVYERG